MSSLVDFQIRELARTKGMVEPFNPDQVNPASYDVTLGDSVKMEMAHGWEEVDISKKPLMIAPGTFVLAYTAELIRIPAHLECIFQLKSSRGREGYEHALAGYIDPGFTGQVTLELTNLNRFHWLPLEAGMRIGQLRFARLDATPHRPYNLTGRYNNDRGAVISKG